MRHLRDLEPIEVRLLPRRVLGPTHLGLLVAPARREPRLAAADLGADVAAIHVAVVAPPAQEEHLAATAAADEAQRVHGSGRDRQELDATREPCDEAVVAPGSGHAA
jgi:hypothetical protein